MWAKSVKRWLRKSAKHLKTSLIKMKTCPQQEWTLANSPALSWISNPPLRKKVISFFSAYNGKTLFILKIDKASAKVFNFGRVKIKYIGMICCTPAKSKEVNINRPTWSSLTIICKLMNAVTTKILQGSAATIIFFSSVASSEGPESFLTWKIGMQTWNNQS